MIISYITEDEYLNYIVDINLFLLLLYIVYINKELFGKKSSASFYFYVLKTFYLCSIFEKGQLVDKKSSASCCFHVLNRFYLCGIFKKEKEFSSLQQKITI